LEPDETRPASLPISATVRDGQLLLDGTDPFVLDAPGADLLVLPAFLDGEVAVVAVEADAPGLTRTTLTTMDQTRRAGRVGLTATPAHLVAHGATASAALRHSRHVARVALAAEQVGGAARCVELTVEYVKQRRQFGVPIGSFQAIKHTCADMLVAVEFARSAAEYAAYCVDERREDLPTAALVASALCAENYLAVAASMIQLHGGVGFTWDNYSHLYYKRAKSSALLYGQPTQQRAELAELIGL
jgi:alkylation response protein AidB-like acyl-CoA dehydrogenase